MTAGIMFYLFMLAHGAASGEFSDAGPLWARIGKQALYRNE
jgi:hypothetical protein